jgi:hypothetical protein
MRRLLHDNWPMIVALAIAVAIGWLLFTVLSPVSTLSAPAVAPPASVASGAS